MESLRRNATQLCSDGSTNFKIDISKYEYYAAKQSFTVDGQIIFGYSPEMAIAERLRAICQQMPEYQAIVHKSRFTAPRDFVDIHSLREAYLINFENAAFHELVVKIFESKRVPLSLIGRIAERSTDHRGDFASVQATVRNNSELNDFEFYAESWLVSASF